MLCRVDSDSNKIELHECSFIFDIYKNIFDKKQ